MLALQSANKDDFILDALPYIDDAEYDDTHRKFAMGLIEEEQRQYPKTKDYLKKFPKPRYERFLTDRLKNEFERMSAKKEMETLDMSRYDVPSPANTPQASDRHAWTDSIQNCKAQLETQNLRQINLEIMEEYAPEAHLRQNAILQRRVEQEEKTVYQLRSQLFDVHSRRKRRQEETGTKILQLGTQWIGLVTKNLKLDEAIVNAHNANTTAAAAAPTPLHTNVSATN